MITADQVQHHVQRRGASGAGKAVTVEGEQAGTHADPWEGFLHRRQAFPMHAAIKAVEQAGAGQRPTAGAYRPQTPRLTGLALQPGYVLTGHGALNTDTAADDHRIHRRCLVHGRVRGDLQAVASPDLTAIHTQCAPAIQFTTGQLVGHAQRFDRRRQGNESEVIQQQKADRLWCAVLGWGPGVVRRHRGISSHNAGCASGRRGLFLSRPRFECRGFANHNANAMPEIEWAFNKTQKRRRAASILPLLRGAVINANRRASAGAWAT
ncbi:hypothetical protein D3C80_512360 [compost metagenome]